MTRAYEVVIGLEVHAQLATATKIFCGCSTRYGADPNHQTCPVCLGLPGVLPVLNRRAVEFAIKLGECCGCTVLEESVFARKNYFYPDVPKNYQISQYELPVCLDGQVGMVVDGVAMEIGLERIHLEEDAGKSIHDQTDGVSSWVDLNRAGVPLVEIVSKPDLTSPEAAGAYVAALRQIVRYLGICDGNMEEGSLRCDANISLRPVGSKPMGTKVEIKNMNSIRGVVAALTHEVERQTAALEAGETISQETRTFDPERGVTVFMRSKEHAHDYRYFPDPDLMPLRIPVAWREEIRRTLPEMPRARASRLVREYEIPEYDASVLTENREQADYFEAAARVFGDGKAVSNWMMSEVMRLLNERGEEIGQFPVGPAGVVELLELIKGGSISGKIAKEVFEDMVASGDSAGEVVEKKGLRQISDQSELDRLVEQVLESHPQQVKTYLDGKESVAGFFVGQLMKATRGQANPQLANQLIRDALERKRGA